MISARAETTFQHAPMAAEIVHGNQEPAKKKQKSSILEHRRVASRAPIPPFMENLDEELQRYGAETQADLVTCHCSGGRRVLLSFFPATETGGNGPASSASSERVFSKLAHIYIYTGVDIRFQKWPDIMSDHIGSWSDMV